MKNADPKYDETFLARWIAGALTSEELKQFELDPHFHQYQKIVEEMEQISAPSIRKELVFDRIKKLRDVKQQTAKIRVIRRRAFITTVAAAFVFLVGFILLFPSSTTLKTEKGQYATHLFPDGSTVQLNSNSIIKFNNKTFIENREVDLKGEAFFDVKPGESFTVSTSNGEVQVLGTSFNVFVRDEIFHVSCKTGKVNVANINNDSRILTAAQQVQLVAGQFSEVDSLGIESIGSWTIGESRFVSTPLREVVLALESQYDIEVKIDASKTSDNFTGGFVHDDLESALEMVFGPMDLEYEIKNNGRIIIR